MGLLSLLQSSLTGGELSPTMWARVDLQRYQNSLALCRNFIVRHWGGADNRPGMRYIGTTANSGSGQGARLIPFIFNNSQTYVLEFGQQYIRFITNGAYIMSGGSPYQISSPYNFSDLPLLKFTQSADVLTIVHPTSQPPQQLSRFSDTNWTITTLAPQNGPFQPANANTAATMQASASTGTMTITASSSIFSFLNNGQLIKLSEITLSSIPPWEPNKQIATGTNSPNGLLRRSNGNVYKCVTTGSPGAGNPEWRTGTLAPTWTSGTEMDGDGNPITTGGATPTVVCGKAGVAWQYLHSQYGIAQLFGISKVPPTSAAANATVLSYIPDSCVSAATWDYAFGSWSNSSGFPAATAYMGDRLVFGGSANEPQTVWMSGVSQYSDFAESNPIIDSDAIDITINSRKINTICDFVPLPNLMILTTGAEFALFGDSSGLITPTSANVRGQSYHGISPTVRAHAIGNSAVFVQARGYIVRDLTYSFQLNAYTGDDLTLYANHLAIGHQMVDSDYAELPYSVVWFVRDDGTLLSMTYVKEQGILGWARHDTLNGKFQNVCVVPEGNEDVLYAVVQRVVNGSTVYYVERMSSRQFTDVKYGVFLDASLSFDGTNFTSTNLMELTGGTNWNSEENLTLTASGAGNTPFSAANVGGIVSLTGADGNTARVNVLAVTSTTVATVRPIENIPASLRGVTTNVYGIGFNKFSGMNHLIGASVTVFGDGGVQGPFVVDNTGAVTLDNAVIVACIGLPIQAQIETLELVYPYGETVSGKSLHSVYKTIPRVNLIVNQSRGFMVGTDFDDLYETKMRWQEDMGEETQMFTGTVEVPVDSTSDISARVCIQVDDPVPVSILGIIPEVSAGQ